MLKRLLPFLFIAAALVGVICLLGLPGAQTLRIVQEDGPIEDATALAFWIGTALCVWRAVHRREEKIFWLEFAVLFCTMAIREGDPHRVVPGFDFLKPAFYSNGNIPLSLRLFFGTTFFGLFGVIAHWGITALFRFIGALKEKAAWTITAVAFLAAEITACLPNKGILFLMRLSLPIVKSDTGFFINTFEEPFELAASILLVWAALQIPPRPKRAAATASR